ncbi:MAG: hypothetical protein ACPG6P_13125, partial [Akkermansiaceae bacterium]
MKNILPLVALSALCLSCITPASAEMRTFTNKAGKKIKAEVVSKTDTHVELDTGKKTYTIALSTLSEADQSFIKNWKDTAAQNKELAEVDISKVMLAKGYTKVEFDEEMNHLFI